MNERTAAHSSASRVIMTTTTCSMGSDDNSAYPFEAARKTKFTKMETLPLLS